MNEKPTDNTTQQAREITAREALDHPATRTAVEFWQRFRQRGRDDTGGVAMFRRALQYCMGQEHHIGYVVSKWIAWSRNPLWFAHRDFRQWPRYIEWVTTWGTTPREMPDKVCEETQGEGDAV